VLEEPQTFPALQTELLDIPTQKRLVGTVLSQHPPRFLMLYGSVRERS
jgi:arsenical resistance protein ArsH